ncbi:MAG: TetR/AcrR family transcriptional regulator [Chloroflexi bacterium]|nr:TetR/AcrR family transcriptional regulator [Chloroflexota bacterium]
MAAFADDGEDVALEAVAARAGVGIGTLYRHFPNRDALVVAAYQHEVDSLCAAAGELLASLPADIALGRWLDRFADYVATKRRMGDALCTAVSSTESPVFAETKARILRALGQILEAGAADGTLRADAAPDDVMRVINAGWYLPDGPQWRETVGRMLALVIDGLRYGAAARAP